MKVLLIGSGGREHALAEALALSENVSELLATPGNPGIGALARLVACEQTPEALADLAEREGVDLTVVGPEVPLVAGVRDVFAARGLRLFGPSALAARIEGNKAWAKGFMNRHGVPTARYETFTALDDALAALPRFGLPVVVKDAALRAGKGVTVCHNRRQAEDALRGVLARPDGCAVVEEFMTGQEVTVMAFCDGERFVTMPPAQDHKPLLEGDFGPMTGGMGVVCPFPLTPEQSAQIAARILAPTLAGLRAEGCPFVGVLYAGVMLTGDGPKVVEFNCRLGDPEAQAVLPLLQSDLSEIMLACLEGRLTPELVRFSGEASAVVVVAAAGYPEKPDTGLPVMLPPEAERRGGRIFHAGTAVQGEYLVSAGGRVLSVQASAPTLPAAIERAYALVDRVGFVGAHVRRDIGFRLGYRPARLR